MSSCALTSTYSQFTLKTLNHEGNSKTKEMTTQINVITIAIASYNNYISISYVKILQLFSTNEFHGKSDVLFPLLNKAHRKEGKG